MLLQNIPNPDYMHGTMALSDSNSMGVGPSVSRTKIQARRASSMHGTMSLSESNSMGVGPTVSRTSRARRAASMLGTMSVSPSRRMGLDSGALGCGCDEADGSMGTYKRNKPASTMGTYRRNRPVSAMGTTGSLGVSFAAPLTRGGFPGEIFTDIPMPTGHWKDAPTPVMLGTDTGMKGTGGFSFFSIIGLIVTGFVYYGAYKYYFGDRNR